MLMKHVPKVYCLFFISILFEKVFTALLFTLNHILELNFVTCGSLLKLKHVQTKYRLHSQDISYGIHSPHQVVFLTHVKGLAVASKQSLPFKKLVRQEAFGCSKEGTGKLVCKGIYFDYSYSNSLFLAWL